MKPASQGNSNPHFIWTRKNSYLDPPQLRKSRKKCQIGDAFAMALLQDDAPF